MRGRKPLPTQIKALRGNPGKRALNHSEPKPDASSVPRAPRWLNEIGKQEWRRRAGELYRLGLLTRLDQTALAAYCDCYATWRAARDQIAAQGLTIFNAAGIPIKHPAVTVREKAVEQMKQYLSEFGMTPSSRSRIKLPDQKTDDPFEQWVEKQLGEKVA
jgi:P27 family predicted phage terminase small subunit